MIPEIDSDATFEEIFGTDAEFELSMRQQRERDDRMERECQEGARRRCTCGAPALFIDETQGPLCAPCGYHFAN